MIEIGSYNTLELKKKTFEGLILTDGTQDVLLPFSEVTPDHDAMQEFFVFVYHHKEGHLVATLKRPYACSGDFAFLKVVDVNDRAAFVDIGLDKDIIVPNREQRRPMEKGNSYVVYLHKDFNDMLAASSYLDEFADTELSDIEDGDEVSILIAERSDLGFTAVINNRHLGLLYHNELYEELHIGDEMQAYIKKIRDNNKIDLSLRPIGFDFILESRDTLLDIIKANGGVLHLGDKSAPEDIHEQLKMSKKAFKQAIGGLYKQRLITISDYEVNIVIDHEAE